MSFVKRVTVVEMNKPSATAPGTAAVATVFKEKRRKVSKGLRYFERADRTLIKAIAVYANELRFRNSRSSFKRRDGWLTDRTVNMWKSERKAWKVLRSAWN